MPEKSKLRITREGKGVTLTAFAISITMPPGMLSQIERGSRPCRRTAERIAAALGVQPVELWPDFETFRKGI